MWLRAPSWRGASQNGSKWPRDETDADWSAKFGGENNSAQSSSVTQGGKMIVSTDRSEFRSEVRDTLNK